MYCFSRLTRYSVFLGKLVYLRLEIMLTIFHLRFSQSRQIFPSISSRRAEYSQKFTSPSVNNCQLRGDGTLKYGDVHEKFIFLETQDLKPLRTGQKHFETILPNFPLDKCKM